MVKYKIHDYYCVIPGMLPPRAWPLLSLCQKVLPFDMHLAHILNRFGSLPKQFFSARSSLSVLCNVKTHPTSLPLPCFLFRHQIDTINMLFAYLFFYLIFLLFLSLNCKCSLREGIWSVLFIAIFPEQGEYLAHSMDSIRFYLSKLMTICPQKMEVTICSHLLWSSGPEYRARYRHSL